MSNKGLITQDSLSWTRMKMNNRLFICDGKLQNMIQSVKARVGKMIDRIKTDMSGLSMTNKALYTLGMIFKSLSIIQAGKSSVEMVREAKKLKDYCTDVSEFMGAMNQSMEGQEQAVRETVSEATNKFGGESKGYAKKLTVLNLIWKALKPALIWIAGYTLQRAAVESKGVQSNSEAPAQMVKTDSVRRIRLDGKAKEKVKAIEQLNQKLPDTGKVGETKKRVKKSIQAIKDPKVPIDKKKLIIGGMLAALTALGVGLAANSMGKSAAKTAVTAQQTANRMEQQARELQQIVRNGLNAAEAENRERRQSIEQIEREHAERERNPGIQGERFGTRADRFIREARRIMQRSIPEPTERYDGYDQNLTWIMQTADSLRRQWMELPALSLTRENWSRHREIENLYERADGTYAAREHRRAQLSHERRQREREENNQYQREVEQRRAQRERERNAAIARTNGVGNANGIHRVQRAGNGFSEAGRYRNLEVNDPGTTHNKKYIGLVQNPVGEVRGGWTKPAKPNARFKGLEMDKATVIRRARDSYYKTQRAHKDFILAYGLIAKGIAKYLSNEQLIRDILYGNIKEDNFVRKFINTYVDQIDDQVKNGGYAQEVVQEKQDFKNKLLRARTIKDLLRIFPNNPGLVRIDKMFMEARKRASR